MRTCITFWMGSNFGQIKIIIIIIIIIVSIFEEDNALSMTANFPYGSLMNTDTYYYRTFYKTYFAIICAIFVRRREATACLIM